MTDQSSARIARFASAIAVMGAFVASVAAFPEHVGPGSGLEGNTVASAISSAQDSVSFATDILPIFQLRCAQCHGAEDENGEIRTEVSLNLLEYERVMAGSEFGTVIEAGDPDGSFLLDMIVAGDMPEEGDRVPEDEIAIIRAWIEAGAPNN